MKSACSLSSSRPATSSETKPHCESNSYRPSAKMPPTVSRRVRGTIPIGDKVPCGVNTRTEPPPPPHTQLRGKVRSQQNRTDLVIVRALQHVERSLAHGGPDIGDARFERWIDAF